MKCLFISLQILRSLMSVPFLRENIGERDSIFIKLSLPETDLFLKLATNSLKNMDLEILESSLALQLTQIDSNIFNLAFEGIFHEESEIRKITTNFIFILYRLSKIKIDLFEVESKHNSEFWSEMLVKIINLDDSLNFYQILTNALKKLKSRAEDIEKNPEDQIIYGNLAIILTIIHKQRVEKVTP